MKQLPVVLRGGIKMTYQDFLPLGAVVVFSGTIMYDGMVFEDFPLLQLFIKTTAAKKKGDGFSEIEVSDKYSNFIPYLKPSLSFRKLMMSEVSRINVCCRNVPETIKSGLIKFTERLHSFSTVDCLVRQAKTEVGKLNSNNPEEASRIAIGVLSSLNVEPTINVDFSVEEE